MKDLCKLNVNTLFKLIWKKNQLNLSYQADSINSGIFHLSIDFGQNFDLY